MLIKTSEGRVDFLKMCTIVSFKLELSKKSVGLLKKKKIESELFL